MNPYNDNKLHCAKWEELVKQWNYDDYYWLESDDGEPNDLGAFLKLVVENS